ncbi:SMP-30/gluconolactonase/LRE family protein [Schlesneria paludicola]|uniref:SMP-30/gluconolactonase/LRE family protein n=1 Tax=Schlesneria paludicola TaxID=360056 RepID=UPI00029A2895|nr:SMP-30/gluconolactonase/LRE family protein [Schlesneria paludicola]
MIDWKWTALIVLAGTVLPLSAADLNDLTTVGSTPTKVVGDCKFTEGPAFSPKGFLLFSDIPNSRIVRLDADGSTSEFLSPSGKANGLVFDAAGHLYACQGGSRRVVKIAIQDGKIEALADRFDGQPLNSPNDLALDGKGGLYFTDPRYGADMKIDQSCMGVYYVDASGKTTRVIDSLKRPNGILVSIDGKSLYVAEPNERQLWQYQITAPGKLSAGKIIFTGDATKDGGGPDGMCLDQHGNIYTTYNGIVVLSPAGELIGRIDVPEHPANCTFGGADGKTLYITARTSLYSLPMKVAGAPLAERGPSPAPQVSRRQSFRGAMHLTQDKNAGDDAKEVEIKGIKLLIPANWKPEKPSNNLRLAQYKPPAADGDKPTAELVVSSFGGDGGGVDQNLKRWNDQFTSEGRKIKLTTGDCPQGKYTLSDISGTYLQSSGGPFAGGKKTPMPEYRSLSVVLLVPDEGAYFLRFTGPEKTITACAEAFRKSFGADAAKETEYVLK